MFKSITWISHHSHSGMRHPYEFMLIDSEFTVFGEASNLTNSSIASSVGARVCFVIQEYSKRKLNVAANLARFFQWYGGAHCFPMKSLIANVREKDPLLLTDEMIADIEK